LVQAAVPEVVIEIPEYGCGPDKVHDSTTAYALSTCSESYFTCRGLYATPTPGVKQILDCLVLYVFVIDYKNMIYG